MPGAEKRPGVFGRYRRTAWAIPPDTAYTTLLLVYEADSAPGMAVGEAIQRCQCDPVVSGLVVRLFVWRLDVVSPKVLHVSLPFFCH